MTSSHTAGPRQWLALAVLAVPCLVYAMDLTVLNLALPAISADLHPSGAQQLWIVDIYGFMVAGALITMGALGDRIGGRRLLMIGATAFAGASVLAAFAPSAELLIAARALLGLAGATVAPSTLSLISALFRDPRQRTVAIGAWVASYSVGAAVGPLAGGALLEHFWWGSVFLLAVPAMAVLLAVGPRLLPERCEPVGGRLDIGSAVLSSGAVLTAVYGLKLLATGGGSEAPLWLLGGLALGMLFIRRQRRLAEPLIDLSLFRAPAYAAALATNLATFLVVLGMAVLTAQYLQSVLGLSPLAAGLWMAPEALGFVAGSLLAPRLRAPKATLVAAGLGAGGVGYVIVAQAGGLAPVVIGSTIGSVGLAVVATLITDIAVSAAPPERAGAASATSETSLELGGALGIAVLGSIAAAVYRAGLPAGAPDEARETLGGAIDSRFAGAARDAFTQSLTVTASVSALVLLAAAMVAYRLLLVPAPASTSRSRRSATIDGA